MTDLAHYSLEAWLDTDKLFWDDGEATKKVWSFLLKVELLALQRLDLIEQELDRDIMATNDGNNHLIINFNLIIIDRLLIATDDDLFTRRESSRAEVTEGKEVCHYRLVTIDGESNRGKGGHHRLLIIIIDNFFTRCKIVEG